MNDLRVITGTGFNGHVQTVQDLTQTVAAENGSDRQMVTVEVSVVVPTCGRADLLKRCLVALCNQDFDKSRYEIIVADDAPSSSTRRVVDELSGRGVGLHYVPVIGRHGPAAARNTGIRLSRGAIIAFTDDDCIPARNWLTAGTSAFVDGVVGAAGKLVVPVSERPTDYEVNAARLAFAQFVTANCFYRKPALLKIGGFDEEFSIAWREDSDLYFRLLKEQKRLTEAPDAVVVHPIRPARWGVSLLQQKKNVFNALLYKKHQGLYRERLAPVVPWHYYGMVVALVVALLGTVSGSSSVFLIASSCWLAGTIAFCLLRISRSSRTLRNIVEMIVTSVFIPPVCIFWRLVGAIRYRVFFL